MPVARRGSSFQVTVHVRGKRVRRSFADHASALRFEAEAISRLERGLEPELVAQAPRGMTMSQLLDAVISRYWAGTANEDGAVANAMACIEIIGSDREVATITSLDVDDCIKVFQQRGNSPATINRKLASLSKLLGFARSRGLLSHEVSIERKRESSGRCRWFTVDEERRILEASAQVDLNFRDLLVFLFDTGARLGEALKLRWVDVDSTFVRFLETKNGRSRAVPQTRRVREVLGQQAGEQVRDLVFGHWFADRFVVARLWARTRTLAGIEGDDAVIHTLRHTCASRLVQRGVPIQVVQQWLGHATLTMTLRYAHLAPHNIVSAAEALERGEVAK
jgi:integrase